MNFIDQILKKYKSNVSSVFFLTGNFNDYFIDEKYKKQLKNQTQDITVIDAMIEILVEELSFDSQKAVQLNNASGIINTIESTKTDLIILKNVDKILTNDLHSGGDNEATLNLYNTLTSESFIVSNKLVIFLISDMTNLNSILKDPAMRAETVNIPLPSNEERLVFIEKAYNQTKQENVKMEVTQHQIMKLTHGMSLYNIEDIFLYARYSGTLNKETIKERKEEIMKKEYDEVLEIIDDCPFTMADYAGNENLKEYTSEIIIDAFKTGDFDIFPKGMLLLGAPGTGKTFLAKCMAGEAGVPYIELKMSKILGKYVGESESKLSKALSGIASMGNCIVLLDEIDQMLKRDNGDSNAVRGNMFSAFLSFLNDSPRGILWIGTTNKCEDIDSALRRSGRFDMKIAVLPPDIRERADLFKINLRKKINEKELEKIDLSKIAKMSFGLTHADIVVVCNKVFELKKRKKMEEINEDLILKAIKYTKPDLSNAFMDMVKSSIDNSSDRELINWSWVREYEEKKKQNNTSSVINH